MTEPSIPMVASLAVVLHPEHGLQRQMDMARLAGRIGYREVWLRTGELPPRADLRALAEAAHPARLGMALPRQPGQAPAELATRVGPDPGDAWAPPLLEVPDPDPALVVVLPGRVRRRVPDDEPPVVRAGEAGVVVSAANRTLLAERVAAARAARASVELPVSAAPVAAAVPVSIGRTMQEAQARALRDARFDAGEHPRERGLYGTYEHGQEQVLELARAGADLLLVTLADELDVADLLAQVRSLVVGATPVLHARGA